MSFVVIVNCILFTCSVGDQAVLENIPGCRSKAGALIPVVRSRLSLLMFPFFHLALRISKCPLDLDEGPTAHEIQSQPMRISSVDMVIFHRGFENCRVVDWNSSKLKVFLHDLSILKSLRLNY